eukprot:gene22163-1298_t
MDKCGQYFIKCGVWEYGILHLLQSPYTYPATILDLGMKDHPCKYVLQIKTASPIPTECEKYFKPLEPLNIILDLTPEEVPEKGKK